MPSLSVGRAAAPTRRGLRVGAAAARWRHRRRQGLLTSRADSRGWAGSSPADPIRPLADRPNSARLFSLFILVS